MASILLTSVGTAIGGPIGGAIGSVIGSVIDSSIAGALAPSQTIEGARLDSLKVTSATEGAVLPRMYGKMRLGGNIIWATDFREEKRTTEQGGKGAGAGVTTTEYVYYASFAIAICEGEAALDAILVDGDPIEEVLEEGDYTYSFYPGSETQGPDPLIEAKTGAGDTPAYRGTAYIVFEDLELSKFGNRIPQFSFVVQRTGIAGAKAAAQSIKAVDMIPGAGEFVYATEEISATAGSVSPAVGGTVPPAAVKSSENVHTGQGKADFLVALDQLQADCPNIESVSLVVAWLGNDLRCGDCLIRPGVESADKTTRPKDWLVNGIDRASAYQVSLDAGGNPNFGGTPADFSVVQAIGEIKARGLRVTFYPFLMMDIPAGNTLPDPYSDGASATGQPAFPWRGRITVSPAPGYTDSPDKTAEAAAQVDAFFGNAAPSDFTVSDSIVIGSFASSAGGGPQDGTFISFPAGAPAVEAGETVTITRDGTPYTLTVDLVQYNAEDGITTWTTGWINGANWDTETVTVSRDAGYPVVSYTGPAGDWGMRRMILHYAHLCYEVGGVDAFLLGSEMRGLGHVRDGASSYPAVVEWQALAADVRSVLGAGPEISYAADWSEYFGHQPADGSGDVFFHLDPLWADANIDFIGIDNYMPLSDWRDGFDHLDAQAGWETIYDPAYLRSNVEGGEGYDWFYASAADRDAQMRTDITDGAYGKQWVFRYKDIRAWWQNQHYDRPGGVENGTPTAWVPESKPVRFTEAGCPAVDKGTNQPNVFIDPKSSESALPWYSAGSRDARVQRRYIEALIGYWTDSNPGSSVYAGDMIDLGNLAIWAWDARPYPAFPGLSDIWADAANYDLGHWLNGRLHSTDLAAIVAAECARAGMDPAGYDADGLHADTEGYVITAISSARAAIEPLAQLYEFDAAESEGVIRFRPRGRAEVATITPDNMVAADNASEDDYEITRAQETELPDAMRWSAIEAGGEYRTVTAEARRVAAGSARVEASRFDVALNGDALDDGVNRALWRAWIERESLMFRLPPSRLALDATDAILLDHDGRQVPLRLTAITDADARELSAVVTDRTLYTPQGIPVGSRPPSAPRPVIHAQPVPAFLNLPWLRPEDAGHRAYIAADADPFAALALYRSPTTSDWALQTTLGDRAITGTTDTALARGPADRFDHTNMLDLTLRHGELKSVSDETLFAGANTLAIEVAEDTWEVIQFADATLIGTLQYRLGRLLRGQRGTDAVIRDSVPAGTRVVVLDDAAVELPGSLSNIGITYNYRLGSAALPVSDSRYTQTPFTNTGVALLPFAPVQPRAAWAGTDLSIAWVRRDRHPNADSWELSGIPMSEEAESYELDILDGATVKRTLASTSTSATYAEADQTADFGAPLTPGTALDIALYQISATAGRGRGLSYTVPI